MEAIPLLQKEFSFFWDAGRAHVSPSDAMHKLTVLSFLNRVQELMTTIFFFSHSCKKTLSIMDIRYSADLNQKIFLWLEDAWFSILLLPRQTQKIRRCRKMSSVIVTKKCTFFENMIWVQTYSVTTEWLWDRTLHPSFPQLPRQCSVFTFTVPHYTFSSYGRLSTFLPLWLSC